MIGILGGTFDPVHEGHLALAKFVGEKLALERTIFIPLGVPPHRPQPHASAALRVNMLTAALESYDNFELDTLEIEKTSPSWTIETLEYFSSILSGHTLCLILGSDAFKPIHTWYRWQSLIQYCHIVVVSRKGDEAALEADAADFLAAHRADTVSDKPENVQGNILWMEADLPEISSSQIRQHISSGQSLEGIVPSSVVNVIKENGIYGYE